MTSTLEVHVSYFPLKRFCAFLCCEDSVKRFVKCLGKNEDFKLGQINEWSKCLWSETTMVLHFREERTLVASGNYNVWEWCVLNNQKFIFKFQVLLEIFEKCVGMLFSLKDQIISSLFYDLETATASVSSFKTKFFL